MKKIKPEIWLILLYCAAVITAGLTLHTHGSYYIEPENDFFNSYTYHAAKLLEGTLVIDDFRGPAYYTVLAGVYFILKNFIASGIIISAISAGFVLFFNFNTIKSLISKRAALIIMLFTMVNPEFIKFSYAPGTDMFCCFFISASIYFFFRKKIILTSVFASLAFLTRYNSALFILCFLLIIIFTNYINSAGKSRGVSLLKFALPLILLLAPWGWYTAVNKGTPFYNQNYRNVAVALNSGGKFEWEEDWKEYSKKYSSFVDLLSSGQANMAIKAARNAGENFFWNLCYLEQPLLSVFVLFGIYMLSGLRHRQNMKLYLLINLIFFLSTGLIFYSTRFQLFLIPFYSMLVYYGIKLVPEVLSGWVKRQHLIYVATVFLISISLLYSLEENSLYMPAPAELKMLPVNTHPDITGKREKMIAYYPHAAFQLGMKWERFPSGMDTGQLIDYMKQNHIDYLFFGEIEKAERKNLLELSDPQRFGFRLKPVIYLKKEGAVLYKLI